MVSGPRQPAQCDIWWSDLGEPIGSTAGFRRPVIIIQADFLNESRLTSYLCVPLTTNARYAQAQWNLPLPKSVTGLPQDSVAQIHLALAADRSQLLEHIGQIGQALLHQLFRRLDLALGRTVI